MTYLGTVEAPGPPEPDAAPAMNNTLYYGDNLHIMANMPKWSVDLIYLDPPFKSDQTYNLIYSKLTNRPIPEQAEAFNDTWEMDAEKERVLKNMPTLLQQHDVDPYYVQFWDLWMKALRQTQPHLLAYLVYMVQRLLYMKTILKPTGSIYLHCDPEASHYIKVMMDGIFLHRNFRSEIIWKRTSAHSSAHRYGPVHDVILYYTMGDTHTWNPQYQEYDDTYLDAFYTHVDEAGRRWRRSDLTGAGVRYGETGEVWRGRDVTSRGRHWAYPPRVMEKMDAEGLIHWPQKASGMPMLKRYADEGKGVPLQDVWSDIKPMHNLDKDRLGFQTQKPVELLKRIIEASSNEGDLVFDPFCGCGTTIYAAHELGRKWIGCDIAILAVRLVEDQLAGC
jgi:DNA modification methylase